MRMSNPERSARALHALQCYQTLIGEVDPTFETTVADLLGDLRHFCDLKGLDFERIDRQGDQFYSAELASEGVGS